MQRQLWLLAPCLRGSALLGTQVFVASLVPPPGYVASVDMDDKAPRTCAAPPAPYTAKLEFRTQAFIDGEFRDALSGRTFVTTNPATGKQLAEIAACDVQDVDVAVAAAKQAFDDGRWSKLQPGERNVNAPLSALPRRKSRSASGPASVPSR